MQPASLQWLVPSRLASSFDTQAHFAKHMTTVWIKDQQWVAKRTQESSVPSAHFTRNSLGMPPRACMLAHVRPVRRDDIPYFMTRPLGDTLIGIACWAQ